MVKEKEKSNKGEIIIYKNKDNKISLKVKIEKETIWMTQTQIADLFEVERSVVTKHLKNIFQSGELIQKSNVQKMHTPLSDKPVNFYNLDTIISVGYRVNSRKATIFRIWATKKLKDFIVKGYVLNQKRLKEGSVKNIKDLEQVITLTKRLIEEKQLDKKEAEGVLRVVADYANSWVLLQKYDEGSLVVPKKKR